MRKAYAYILVLCLAVSLFGVAAAVFVAKSKITGSRFSVGSASVRLLKNVAGGIGDTNLAEEIPGPSFLNITSNWQSDYAVKIYNTGTQVISLNSKSNYTTAGDPDNLRELIYVEPFEWNDTNEDGVIDQGEKGASLGTKTLLKWKTEGGIALGDINPGQLKSYVFTFSTQTVADTKQGKTGVLDFELEGIGL